MESYLQPLYSRIKTLLPKNSYFTLDDSSQSFVVFPTNHIHVVDEFISIEIATCIYGNITENETIINNISELFTLLTAYAEYKEDYCSINIVGSSCIRLVWGGFNIDQDSKDFNSVKDLINYLKEKI